MAHFGYIDEIVRTGGLEDRLLAGLDYLAGLTDEAFEGLEEGSPRKVVLDGDRLFAIDQIYTTRPVADARFEGHRRYLDLQYIHDGSERLGRASIRDCEPTGAYDEDQDLRFFYAERTTLVTMTRKTVCILYPDDVHAPGLILGEPTLVRKSVVKVLL